MNSGKLEGYITFGKITSTHGIKGAFVVRSHVDDASLFILKDSLTLDEQKFSVVLDGVKNKGLDLILLNSDIKSIDDAKKLVGKTIYCKKSILPQIKTDHTYYVGDLIEMSVIDYKTNSEYGFVSDVVKFSEEVFLEVKSNSGNLEYFEFNSQNFPVVNIESSLVMLDKPEYLLDEDEAQINK